MNFTFINFVDLAEKYPFKLLEIKGLLKSDIDPDLKWILLDEAFSLMNAHLKTIDRGQSIGYVMCEGKVRRRQHQYWCINSMCLLISNEIEAFTKSLQNVRKIL